MADVEASIEAEVARQIDVSHRLAALGYGPLERPKLTAIETKELIEGSIRAERSEWEKEVRLRGGDPEKAERQQQANDEMVSELQAEIDEIKNG